MIQDTSSQDRPIAHKTGRWTVLAIGGSLLVVAAAALVFPAFKRWTSADLSFESAQLNQAMVERGDLVRDLGVEGRIVASSYPTIYSPAEGSITLAARAGDRVTAGQKLAVIESPELRNMLQQERSQYDALASEHDRQKITAKTTALKDRQQIDLRKLEFEAAVRAHERAKITYDKGLIGAAEFEKTADDVAIADLEHRHAVDQAALDTEIMDFEIRSKALLLRRQELVLEEVQRRVSDLEIRSPVDGVIGTVNVDPRDQVSTNQALLTVIDLSAFEIKIDIPETYADEIGPGIATEITYENKAYEGMVTAVAPEVNNSLVTGTVVFTAELPHGLRQNQRVSTRIILSTRTDVVKVRRGPFLESGGGRKAYVVEQGMARLRPIRTGTISLTEVEVLAGLTEGETIIISDISRFQEAETVLLID